MAAASAAPTTEATASIAVPAEASSSLFADTALEAKLSPLLEASVYAGVEARQVLYTWTTREQLAALRRTGVLLMRSESPTYGASLFDHALSIDQDPTSTAMASALATPRLAKRRFAWTAPWATLFGLADTTYGDELLRVVVRRDAVIGRYAPGEPSPWSFFDGRGNPVAVAEVVARNRRGSRRFTTCSVTCPGASWAAIANTCCATKRCSRVGRTAPTKRAAP